MKQKRDEKARKKLYDYLWPLVIMLVATLPLAVIATLAEMLDGKPWPAAIAYPICIPMVPISFIITGLAMYYAGKELPPYTGNTDPSLPQEKV